MQVLTITKKELSSPTAVHDRALSCELTDCSQPAKAHPCIDQPKRAWEADLRRRERR